MKSFDLPPTLLLGSATAATQIEGGDTNVNWYRWSLKGHVAGGESSLPGAGHWDRVDQDVALLAELNQQCYRLGLEWSRLEPAEGQWSAEGVAHYRHELGLLRQRGIVPLVTLHHFSCPQWFQDRGAWLADDAVATFLRFVERVVDTLGDLVDEWCTINEPNVFSNDTYMEGKFPGGRRGDIGAYFRASAALIRAHLGAYRLIHRLRDQRGWKNTRVGFAHHLAVFVPKNPLAWLGTALSDYLFHEIFFQGFVEGRMPWVLGGGRPEGRGRFCDYLGINYYSRHLFTGALDPGSLFARVGVDPAVPPERLNDLGWEIYPEGLAQWTRRVWRRWHLPVHITENGIADARDEKRAAFLVDHLDQVRRLVDEGVAIERYYHWSFLDNLEWSEGYAPRFGLVEVDYATMERRVRPSGRVYAEICRTHRVGGAS